MTLCVYFISIQRPIYLFSFDYDKGGCYAISLAILIFHFSSFYLKHFVAYNQEATEKFIHRLTKNQKPSFNTNVLHEAVITCIVFGFV